MYSAVATSQVSTVELIGTFKPMLNELLRRYQKRNDDLPGAVIYWRDGISESQIPEFMEKEVKDLKSELQIMLVVYVTKDGSHFPRSWTESQNHHHQLR